MKKIVALILILALCLPLCACSSTKSVVGLYSRDDYSWPYNDLSSISINKDGTTYLAVVRIAPTDEETGQLAYMTGTWEEESNANGVITIWCRYVNYGVVKLTYYVDKGEAEVIAIGVGMSDVGEGTYTRKK